MAGPQTVGIKYEIAGDHKIVLGLRKVSQETIEALQDAMVMGGNMVRNRMMRGMQRTPKLGRVYKRTKRGRMHRASVSPNYPAIDRGGLFGSIMLDEKHLDIEVGSSIAKLRKGKNKYGGLQYPIFLEKGTKKMGKRPWVQPSFDRSRGAIVRSIERAVQRTIMTAGAK